MIYNKANKYLWIIKFIVKIIETQDWQGQTQTMEWDNRRQNEKNQEISVIKVQLIIFIKSYHFIHLILMLTCQALKIIDSRLHQ